MWLLEECWPAPDDAREHPDSRVARAVLLRLELLLSAALLAGVALAGWAVFRLLVAWRRHRISLPREAVLAAAVVYGAVLVVITIVPLRLTNDRATHVNLIPFASVLDCVTGTAGPREAPQYCIENVVGNVMLFTPLGVLLPAISSRFRSSAALIAAALVISAGIEAVQWTERNIGVGRTVDVDDVLWNAVGAYLGSLMIARLRYGRWWSFPMGSGRAG